MSLHPLPRLAFVSTLLAAVVSLAAAAPTETWVYVGTYTGGASKGIYRTRLDAEGHLTPAVLAAESPNPSFLAVSPSQQALYAANETDTFNGQPTGAVTAFALDPASGALRQLNQRPSHGAGPAHVSVDGHGRVVLVANYNGGSIASFPIEPDGSLGAAVSAIQNHGSSVNPNRQASPHAHCLLTDPSDRFAVLCDLGLDQVRVYRLNAATGALTLNDPPFARVAPGSGPRHIAFRPDGQFAYVINEMACTVTVFSFDANTGALHELQTVSTLPAGASVKPGYAAAEIAVHPSGHFLYASTRGANCLAVFAIDATSGRLQLVQHVPSGGAIPRQFAIAPGGRLLLAANQDSGNIAVFRLDPDSGRLAPTSETLAVDHAVALAFVPVAK